MPGIVHHYLERLRRQPEITRLRLAASLTLGGGLVIGFLWLTVLLPMQIKEATQSSQVAGTRQDEPLQRPVESFDSPTPTPLTPLRLDLTP